MNISKFNKGITLIALVITIVVLLILAGITLATLTGENGLFSRAKEAKEKTNEGTAREIIITKLYDYQANEIAENKEINLEGLKEYLKQDKEIEYINLYIKKDELVAVQEGENATHAKIKLKEYNYEYLLDSNLNIIAVNGKEIKPDGNDKDDNVEEKPELKEVTIDDELERLLKEANMTITLKDILNTPAILNELKGLIPTLTENDVTRNEENGIISYVDNKGGISKTNSEDSREIYKVWKAFDNDKTTNTCSKVEEWQNYYLEYEFPQEVYAMQIKYIFTNISSEISTRVIVIQAYNEEKNSWEDLTEELNWTGAGANPKENIESLNYTKSYKRYRLYVKSGTNPTGSGKCSGLYEMQFYGVIANGVNINSEEEVKKILLSNSNLEEITLNHMVTNEEFTKRLVDALSLETVTNNETLMNNLPKLIPTITESDVTRSEQNGIISYTVNNGGIIRTNSEDTREILRTWKAFDNNKESASRSKIDQWKNYYIEYEFPQEVYAMQIRYIFTNASSGNSTRVIVIQGFNQEKNEWEDLTKELNWSGTNTSLKEDIENMDYTKSYKRYRLFVKGGTNPTGSGKCSGLYEMQFYGKVK